MKVNSTVESKAQATVHVELYLTAVYTCTVLHIHVASPIVLHYLVSAGPDE